MASFILASLYFMTYYQSARRLLGRLTSDQKIDNCPFLFRCWMTCAASGCSCSLLAVLDTAAITVKLEYED